MAVHGDNDMQCEDTLVVRDVLKDVQDEEQLHPLHHQVLLAQLQADILQELGVGRFGFREHRPEGLFPWSRHFFWIDAKTITIS